MPPQEKAKVAANTTKTTGTPDEARSRPTKRVSKGAMMPKTSTTPTPRARKMPHNTAPTLFLTMPSYQAAPERRVAGFTRGVRPHGDAIRPPGGRPEPPSYAHNLTQ